MKKPRKLRRKTENEWKDIAKSNLPKFVEEHCTIWSLFDRRALALISQLPHEQRKEKAYKKLKDLLAKDPNKEVWIQGVYYPYDPECSSTNKKEFRSFEDLWVSNKGRVFDLRRYRVSKGTLSERGYVSVVMGGYTMMMHRLIASSWLPKPKQLDSYPFSELEVNHIVAIKHQNPLDNLEWVTPAQNKQHAKENNLLVSHKHLSHPFVIPMRGTVIDIPGFKKRVIYVCGKDQCEKFGLDNRHLHAIRIGKIKTHKGCKWEEVSKEEYAKYYKDPDQDLINAIRNYAYDRTGRKSNRSDRVTWELTHKRTKCVTRLTGTIELANFGTNSANMNRSYKNNGMYKNYFIKKLNPNNL